MVSTKQAILLLAFVGIVVITARKDDEKWPKKKVAVRAEVRVHPMLLQLTLIVS